MLTQDHLNLQRVELTASQEWPHKGEHLTFILPNRGCGKWIAGPGSHRLAAGDVLVLDAALGGKVCVASPGEFGFSYFSLHLEHLFPLFASREICLLQHVSIGFRIARLYAAAGPIAQECHRRLAEIPDRNNLDHRSRLLHAAAAILTDEFDHVKNGRVGFARTEEHMIEVFKRLTVVEWLTCSVSELASKFGCGRRHLNRLFHHYFGVSVAALRMEMRLLRSVTLLRDPDSKVIRVAEDCGFNQLGLFNACFKRRFGTTPGQWRKLHQQPDRPPERLEPVVLSCPLQINGVCPLTNHSTPAGCGGSCEMAVPAHAGPAKLVNRTKSPPRVGNGQPPRASGQPVIRKITRKRVAVRTSP